MQVYVYTTPVLFGLFLLSNTTYFVVGSFCRIVGNVAQSTSSNSRSRPLKSSNLVTPGIGATAVTVGKKYICTILVGECSEFLASGSDPTDDSRIKH